jgi:hypothetical protein
LVKKSYCLFYFKNCNLTEYLCLHNANGINFVHKLINIIEGKKEIQIKTKIIHKIGDSRYIIIIPEDFYSKFSLPTIKQLFSYLREGDFNEVLKNYIALHRSGIVSFIDALGGLYENLFVNFNKYCNIVI